MTNAEYAVRVERDRQDEKWGEQNHDPEWWLAILMEEVGELAQCVLEAHFSNGPNGTHLATPANVRQEAVHCAAVALAMIESLDRAAERSAHQALHKAGG